MSTCSKSHLSSSCTSPGTSWNRPCSLLLLRIPVKKWHNMRLTCIYIQNMTQTTAQNLHNGNNIQLAGLALSLRTGVQTCCFCDITNPIIRVAFLTHICYNFCLKSSPYEALRFISELRKAWRQARLGHANKPTQGSEENKIYPHP